MLVREERIREMSLSMDGILNLKISGLLNVLLSVLNKHCEEG